MVPNNPNTQTFRRISIGMKLYSHYFEVNNMNSH